jgi:flagellin-like protein
VVPPGIVGVGQRGGVNSANATMQLKALYEDDDAVSPVIGVILMVAITVILAAVIATFVLGLGEQISDTSPQANFDFEYDSGASELEITHTGGETIEASNLFIVGSDGTDGDWTTAGTSPGAYGSNSEVSAGNSLTVSATDSDTVRVVWRTDEGGQSAELAIWEGSDA